MLSNTIISLLACPICKEKLTKHKDGFECRKCETIFPIIKNVPVLINKKNSLFSVQSFYNNKSERKYKRILKKIIPRISLNLKAKDNYLKLSDLLRERQNKSLVLVVGGGSTGQGIELIVDNPNIIPVETDVYFGKRNQIVADAHDLPFFSGSFDAVIIQVVLEHVVDPHRCVEEIYRVLKNDGIVYAETPFMQQVHGGEFDFTRFTLGGHRRLFRYFKEIDSGIVGGPGMVLAWSISYFVGSFSKSRALKYFRFAILPFFIFWLKYFDYYFIKKPWVSDAASGVFFIGIKSNSPVTDKEIIKNYWKNVCK
jgi:SAM-dependent methyltransferase